MEFALKDEKVLGKQEKDGLYDNQKTYKEGYSGKVNNLEDFAKEEIVVTDEKEEGIGSTEEKLVNNLESIIRKRKLGWQIMQTKELH